MHKAKAIMGFYFVHDEEGGGVLPLIFKEYDTAQNRANRCLQRFESKKALQVQACELLAKLLEHNKRAEEHKATPHKWAEIAAERRKLIQ